MTDGDRSPRPPPACSPGRSAGSGPPAEREGPPPTWEQGEGEIVGDFNVFRVRRQPTRSPRTGRDMDYHVIEAPDWVHVVPVSEDGRLILVEQFRHGIGDVGLEFPAGILESDEPPVDAGLRELEEETGYIAADARVLASLSPNPALQSNRVNIVVATGCRPIGRRSQDEGEDLRVRLVESDAVPALIRDRRIRDVHSVAAWHLYAHASASP